jgi:hypothetical protein
MLNFPWKSLSAVAGKIEKHTHKAVEKSENVLVPSRR